MNPISVTIDHTKQLEVKFNFHGDLTRNQIFNILVDGLLDVIRDSGGQKTLDAKKEEKCDHCSVVSLVRTAACKEFEDPTNTRTKASMKN